MQRCRFGSIWECSQYKNDCIAWLIYLAFTICLKISYHLISLPLPPLWFSFAVPLPLCQDANNSVLESYQQSGDWIYVTTSESVLLPRNVWETADPWQVPERLSVVSSENKLCRRTWQLFLFLQWHKKNENETGARVLYRKVLLVGKRRGSLEMTNEPKASFPHCCK